MNWKLFVQSLAVSALAGSANATSQNLKNSGNSKTNWRSFGAAALVGAATGALTFFLQPPEPAAAVTAPEKQ